MTIDASWDWSTYGASRPCALVNNTASPPILAFTGPGFGVVLPAHVYNAAITFTDKKGEVVAVGVTGGSVCEVVVPGSGGDGSINEWVIAFEGDGSLSTGKYAGRRAVGQFVMRFDSSTGAVDLFPGPNFLVITLDK